MHFAAFATISVVAEAWSAVLQMLFNPWDHKQRPTFMDTLEHVTSLSGSDVPDRLRADIDRYLCDGFARTHGPPDDRDRATQ